MARTLFRYLLPAFALLCLVGLWIHAQGADRRAIDALPEAERQALYGQELAGFRSLCEPWPRSEGFQRRCSERAGFLQLFPECQTECQALLEPFLGTGTR